MNKETGNKSNTPSTGRSISTGFWAFVRGLIGKLEPKPAMAEESIAALVTAHNDRADEMARIRDEARYRYTMMRGMY